MPSKFAYCIFLSVCTCNLIYAIIFLSLMGISGIRKGHMKQVPPSGMKTRKNHNAPHFTGLHSYKKSIRVTTPKIIRGILMDFSDGSRRLKYKGVYMIFFDFWSAKSEQLPHSSLPFLRYWVTTFWNHLFMDVFIKLLFKVLQFETFDVSTYIGLFNK